MCLLYIMYCMSWMQCFHTLVMQGSVTDMREEKVVQPLLVTSSALTLATECVRMILKVRFWCQLRDIGYALRRLLLQGACGMCGWAVHVGCYSAAHCLASTFKEGGESLQGHTGGFCPA